MKGKIKSKGIFRVSCYFNEQQIISMVEDSEKLKFRRVGIPIKKQKPNGFSGEWFANTDGISKLLKYCYKYYKENESERVAKLAIKLKEKENAEIEIRKLGGF